MIARCGLHDSHAHQQQRAEFLAFVDGDGPDDLPWEECEDYVHEAREGYRRLLVSFCVEIGSSGTRDVPAKKVLYFWIISDGKQEPSKS